MDEKRQKLNDSEDTEVETIDNSEYEMCDAPSLVKAVETNQECLYEELIRRRVDVDQMEDGVSALHVAVERQLTNAVRLLLQAGADVNIKDHLGRTPLHIAVLNNDRETMDILLGETNILVDAKDDECDTALHLAIRKSVDYQIIRALLDNAADFFHTFTKNGNSALQLALESNRDDLVKLIESMDIPANVILEQNCMMHSALDSALNLNMDSIVRKFIDGHVNVAIAALFHAAKHGNLTLVTYLLDEMDVDVDAVTSDSDTALHLAAGSNRADVVRVLLEHNASFKFNRQNFNPLHLAISSWSEASIKLLMAIRPEQDLPVLQEFGYRAFEVWKTHDTLVQSFMKFLAVGMFVDEHLVKLPYFQQLQTFCNEKFDLSECRRAVEQMKLTKITRALTAFDLLAKPMWRLVHFFPDDERIEDRFEEAINERGEVFSVYTKWLISLVYKAADRVRLLPKCNVALKRMAGDRGVDLPAEVCSFITDYLSNVELINLANVYDLGRVDRSEARKSCILTDVHGGALQLTSSNIDMTLAGNELIIVNFYADWCRFSNMLQPIFDEAADKVAEKFPQAGRVVLAKVDCEKENAIARRFHITKYPTLKIIKNGQPSKREYRGSRKAESFLEYVQKELEDPIKEFHSLQELAELQPNKSMVIGYFEDKDSNAYNIYRRVASNFKDDCIFYAGFGEVVQQMHPPGKPIVVFRPDKLRSNADDETYDRDEKIDNYDTLNVWITSHCVPLVREITFENAEEFTEEGLPFLILFHAPGDNDIIKRYTDVVHKQLINQKHNVNFLTADGEKFFHPLHHLGKSTKDLPLIAIDSFRHMYLFPNTKDMEVPGKLEAFLADLYSGKLHREYHYGPDQPDTEASSDDEKKKATTPPESMFKNLGPSKNRYTLLKDEL